MILTRGNWFQTNPLEHESDDRAGNTVSSVCVLPMVKILHFSGKFDQHLSLCCGYVKLKFTTGPEYWISWESCELWFPKFTDNFGTVSSNMHVKAVPIFTPMKWHGEKWRVQFVWNQCQWKCDVSIHNDVPLYLRMTSN